MTRSFRGFTGLLFFLILALLPVYAVNKRGDIGNSQDGFFSNCPPEPGGGVCAFAQAQGAATLTGTDKSGNPVTVTINLYDWGFYPCTQDSCEAKPLINFAVLDVVLTGTDSAGVESVVVKGVLSSPDYVSCDTTSGGLGCIYSPLPDSSNVPEPTPIAGADTGGHVNTRWDFGGLPPLNPPLPAIPFDQLLCVSGDDPQRADTICESSPLGEAILVVANSVKKNKLTTSSKNYLVTLTDGTTLGTLAVPKPPTESVASTNNTQATATIISGTNFQDYTDASLAYPQINADGSEQYPQGFTPLPLTNPPPCNPTNGVTFETDNRTFRTAWYSYTAPSNGSVTLSTAGSRYDTLIYVFTGSASQPTVVSCNDDPFPPNGLLQAAIAFNVSQGVNYQIVVGETPSYQTNVPGELTGYPLSVNSALHFSLQFSTNSVKSPTVTTLSSSPNPSNFGQTVNFTAKVDTNGVGTPTGTVTFDDGATVLGSSPLSGGTASFSTASLPAGTNSISATYNGDARTTPSTSNSITIQVNKATATVTLGSLAATYDGTPKAATATTNPTGLAVTFTYNGNSTAPTAPGSYTVVGTVSDPNYTGSATATLVITGKLPATVTLGHLAALFDGAPKAATAATNPSGLGVTFTYNGNPDPPFAVGAYTVVATVKDLVYTGSATGTLVISKPVPSAAFNAAAGSPLTAGSNPEWVVLADFNGGGKPDMAVANAGSNSVTVFLGNGSGGFTPAPGSPFAVGAYPAAMAVGDLNGDGKLDLAVVGGNYLGGTLTVLLGDGSGRFTAVAGSPFAVGPCPGGEAAVAIGDFNGDGKPDIATNGTIMLGDGLGGFTSTPAAFGSGSAVADVNGDGILDIVAPRIGEFGVTVLLGNGSGGFTPVPNNCCATSIEPNSVVVADFNGDGQLDIAVAGGQYVQVLFGNGTGYFSTTPFGLFYLGGAAMTLSQGDFNGDGIPDLAVPIYGSNNVAVLLGNGAAGFTSAVASPFTAAPGSPFAVGTGPYAVAVADLNGDGRPDLAVANLSGNNVTVLLGAAAPVIVPVTIASAPAGLSLTVDGAAATTPATFNWTPGSQHTVAAAATIAGSNGTQYVFQNWSQGGTASQTITAPASASTYTAAYQTQYYLTTNAAGNGTISPASGWYNAGAVISVGAAPASGSYLIGFSGALSGTANPQNLTMNGPETVSASFGNAGAFLTAAISTKADGTLANERVWTVNLTNTGTATATNAAITGVQILQITGSATVTLSPSMTLPVAAGTIAAGGSASVPIRLIFPSTSPASRISIKISYAADGGVAGTTTFNNQFR